MTDRRTHGKAFAGFPRVRRSWLEPRRRAPCGRRHHGWFGKGVEGAGNMVNEGLCFAPCSGVIAYLH